MWLELQQQGSTTRRPPWEECHCPHKTGWHGLEIPSHQRPTRDGRPRRRWSTINHSKSGFFMEENDALPYHLFLVQSYWQCGSFVLFNYLQLLFDYFQRLWTSFTSRTVGLRVQNCYNTRDLGIVSPGKWSLYPFSASEPFTSISLKSWSSPSPSTGKGRNRPPSRPDLGGILMKRNPQTRRGVSQEWSQTLIWVCPAAHHSSHSCCKSDTGSSAVASVASANRPRFIESKQHAIYVLGFMHAIWSRRGTVLGYPECRCISYMFLLLSEGNKIWGSFLHNKIQGPQTSSRRFLHAFFKLKKVAWKKPSSVCFPVETDVLTWYLWRFSSWTWSLKNTNLFFEAWGLRNRNPLQGSCFLQNERLGWFWCDSVPFQVFPVSFATLAPKWKWTFHGLYDIGWYRFTV